VITHHYTKFKPWMLNGHPGNITRACKRAIVRAVNHGLVVTSTTDGAHAATSWHAPRRLPPTFRKVGRAVDVGTDSSVVGKAARERKIDFQHSELKRSETHGYRELLGPDNGACILKGERVRLANHSALEDQHDTHTHVAPKS
jgi:hypothetical protein